MTNHYARTRRNRGAWYEALQVDQAISAGYPLDDIRDFDDAVKSGGLAHVLIAADNPAPARGYALIVHTGDEAFARVHVLATASDDVYRALMSQARVQIDHQAQRSSGEDGLTILVDTEALAEHVAEAITRLGAPYGVQLNHTTTDAAAALRDAPTETIAEQTADHIENGLAESGSATVVRSGTEPLKHTVTYVYFTPGDTSEPNEHTYQATHDETAPIPTDPEPVEGYEFAGWVHGDTFEAFDFATTPITSNVTVIQSWTEHEAESTETAEKTGNDQTHDTTTTDAPQGSPDPEQVTEAPQAATPTGDTFPCPEFGCGKTYGTARGLKIHTNTHTK